MGSLQQAESNLIATQHVMGCDQVLTRIMKIWSSSDDTLHPEHGVHEELEPAHANPARRAVFIHLDRIEIVAQKSAHVFEDTILWLQEVDPREEIQYQIALDIVRFLEHVQPRVRLADGFSLRVSVRYPQNKTDTHQGKPAVITSMSPGCGGGGSLELSERALGTSSSNIPRYDLTA
jgi:hypothetical protein